jgi:hypothetical protein
MQVKFNLCRFLRRAVERETRRDVGLAILKYAGLLELLLHAATSSAAQYADAPAKEAKTEVLQVGRGEEEEEEEESVEESVSSDRAKLEAYLVLQTILDPAYLMSYPGIAGLDCKRIRSFHRV